PPPPRQLADYWTALQAEDPVRAYPAVWALAAGAPDAIPFLRARMRPVTEADPRHTARLIADLDGPHFQTREEATQALEQLGESTGPGLRRALVGRPPAAVRGREGGVLPGGARPRARVGGGRWPREWCQPEVRSEPAGSGSPQRSRADP